MFDFKAADEEIARNSDLMKALNSLVHHVITMNKCEFKTQELEFDTTLLFQKQILKSRNSIIELEEHDLLYYVSLKEFYQKFDYKLNDNIGDLFRFLEAVKAYLFENATQGKSRFTAGLTAIALFHQHKMFRPALDEFCQHLESRTWQFTLCFFPCFGYYIPMVGIQF